MILEKRKRRHAPSTANNTKDHSKITTTPQTATIHISLLTNPVPTKSLSIIVYILLIALLRISGKRTLSDMNIFDFVITVVIGTIFSSTIISKNVVILDGLLALVLLIVLQFILAWLTVRSNRVQKLTKSRPTILFFDGEYQLSAMKRERVSRGEILQAMRSQGISIEEQVSAVVLETNGNFSVIKKIENTGRSTLEGSDDQLAFNRFTT